MTYGGLMTNTHGQLLRKVGEIIEGLYAAGDNATGLCGPSNGHNASPGYLTGCGNMAALCFGRIAGKNVAQGQMSVDWQLQFIGKTMANNPPYIARFGFLLE